MVFVFIWVLTIYYTSSLGTSLASHCLSNQVYDLGTTICPRHRDPIWRGNNKNCACPHEWASHMAVKGERGLTLNTS